MNSKPRIELFPWSHMVTDQGHAELVTHVRKTIPKNSVVFIELTRPWFDIFSAAASPQEAIEKIGRLYGTIPDKDFKNELLAYAELFAAFRQKNIQIHPIEVHLRRIPSPKNETDYWSQMISLSRFRENAFCRQLESELPMLKRGAFVITGMGHSEHIANRLRQKGFEVQLRTDIFSQQKLIEQFIACDTRLRNAVTQKDEAGIRIFATGLNKIGRQFKQRVETDLEKRISDSFLRQQSRVRTPKRNKPRRPTFRK